jgi:hypothetical protein
MLGLHHTDCQMVKKRLNETVKEMMKQGKSQNIRSQSTFLRNEFKTDEMVKPKLSSAMSNRPTSSSVRILIETSPKQKLNRYIDDLKRTSEFNALNKNKKKFDLLSSTNELDQWINRNSIIEVIPSKLDQAKNVVKLKQVEENEFISNDFNRPLSLRQPKSSSNSSGVFVLNKNSSNSTATCLNSLLKPDPKEAKLKISKHIYYNTAWHDFPPNSIKARYKNFVKLVPNA